MGLTLSNKKRAGYFIGKTEVTNREYARFVATGGYTKAASTGESRW
jgi:formylglycine-generating enzyme required for sulfatase activity